MKITSLKFFSDKEDLASSLIALCSVILSLMLFAIVRDQLAVSIEVLIPDVRTKVVGPVGNPHRDGRLNPMCSDARVNWVYNCESEMSYSYVDKQKLGNKWLVTIRIEGVLLRLSLGIDAALAKDAPARLDQHNEGHVLICKTIYKDAEKFGRAAVAPVLRRTFTGEGDTVDEASAQAVSEAAGEIANRYKEDLQVKTQDVTEIYDFLEINEPKSVKNSIEQAFQLHSAGKTRRLIE